MHDHATGRVLNGHNWEPSLLQGSFNSILVNACVGSLPDDTMRS